MMDTQLLERRHLPIDDEPYGSDDLVRDLEIERILLRMSRGDDFIKSVCRAALLHPLHDVDEIRRRQGGVEDCIRNDDAVRAIYDLAGRALDVQRSIYMSIYARRPAALLSRAQRLLADLGGSLLELRRHLEDHESAFRSPAFRAFAETVRTRLDDEFMARYREQVRRLEFRSGVGMRVRLGRSAEIIPEQLHTVQRSTWNPLSRLTSSAPSFSFTIPERDESGANAAADLRDRALVRAAQHGNQALEDVLGFFRQIRTATAFYLGAANLADELTQLGGDLVMPRFIADDGDQRIDGLYDPSLALRLDRRPTLNDIDLHGKPLLVITGANQAGKSTTLRALGLLQLFAQAGMHVPASHADVHIVGRVFTHWAREEDSGLVHGKFDEELQRVSDIVRRIRRGDVLLSNESFSSTNETEGSTIAAEVIRALVGSGVRVWCVTHLFTFANDLWQHDQERAHFVRAAAADPDTDGSAPFRLAAAPPEPTSHGADVFNRVFGTDLHTESTP
ncbi:hypothetical protein P9139_13785 [Curtobacterium flaccumfaciens]|nr:hypothetical protein P9139_13785 [Curtobacterium flaccumfaciens]